MRNMSFALTTQQVKDRTKFVTRRFAWWNLKPGTRLWAVEKGMGLKAGEKISRLGVIEIIHVSQQRVDALLDRDGPPEMRLEGYPMGLKDPVEFMERMCLLHNKMGCDTINRIEFGYITTCAGCGLDFLWHRNHHYRHCCSHSCARDFYN